MDLQKLQGWVYPIGITILALVALLVARTLVFKSLAKVVGKTKTNVDDMIIRLVRTPSLYWCFAISLSIGISFAELPQKMEKQMNQLIHVLLILSLTLVMANIAATFFRNLLKSNHPNTETSALSIGIVKGLVFSTGIAFMLSVMGISIAPVLTALGVGGLAVALALKDTLENLFAGIYLLTDKTIRVGDFVRLDSGQEGFVSDIGWRTAKFRNASHSTIIIPNSKLASSILTNHSYPDRRIVTTIALQLDGKSDLNVLENRLLSILKKGSEDIVGMLASPDPSVRLAQILPDGSIIYNLNFSIKEMGDLAFVSHEIRKRVLVELKALGISFPQPTMKLVQ